MDFQPTEERRMLGDTLRRYLADRYPVEHRNKVVYAEPYHDPARWAEMADLGILHALVPQDQGGFGGSGFDITTVFEALGAALCPEPFLGALMAARLLDGAGDDLTALLDGGEKYAVAMGETDGAVAAVRSDDGWAVSGRESVVYGGGIADVILLVAEYKGAPAVFAVRAPDSGITSYGMIDGGNGAQIFVENLPAALVALNAEALVQGAMDAGSLALCAEAVGAMDTSAAMLLEYLKTRQQFGRAIGSFQALQHRMVDLTVEIEQARSITILAASQIGQDGGSRVVSMAKSLVGRVAQLVAEEMIQMFGGIAMTWEHPASHFAKRLVMIDHQLGDSDQHLQRVMAGYTTG